MSNFFQSVVILVRVLATIAMMDRSGFPSSATECFWIAAAGAVTQSSYSSMPTVFELDPPSPVDELPPPVVDSPPPRDQLLSSMCRLRCRDKSSDSLRSRPNMPACIISDENSDLTWRRPSLTVVTDASTFNQEPSPIISETTAASEPEEPPTLEQIAFNIMAALTGIRKSTEQKDAGWDKVMEWMQTIDEHLLAIIDKPDTVASKRVEFDCLRQTFLQLYQKMDPVEAASANVLCADLENACRQVVLAVQPASIGVPIPCATAQSFSLSKSFPTLSKLRSFRYSLRASTSIIPPTPPISPAPRLRDSSLSECNSVRSSSVSADHVDEVYLFKSAFLISSVRSCACRYGDGARRCNV
jgi:hypothetical protein